VVVPWFGMIILMRQSAEFKSRKEWELALWEDFLERIERANLQQKIKPLFNSVLSQNEKRLIIRRLAAVSLIRKGKSYKEIGEILWLSPNTISSIKKGLKSGNFYRSRESKRKERPVSKNKTGLLSDVIEFIDYWLSVMPPMVGGGRWKFLNRR